MDEEPVGKPSPVRIIREDLIATIWPQYQTMLRGLGIIAQVAIDLLSDPTRLGTHVSLHQVAIDQVKAMAIGHRQQILGGYNVATPRKDTSCHLPFLTVAASVRHVCLSVY